MKKRLSRDEYLDQALRALVGFFGVEAVKRGITVIESNEVESNEVEAKRAPSDRPAKTGLPKSVIAIAKDDPARFELLRPFFERLIAGEVLPQSEDIRRFADLLRIKEPLSGGSRRDLIRHLTAPLLALPLDELPAILQEADSILEEQRRKGYSLLTDHYLERMRR